MASDGTVAHQGLLVDFGGVLTTNVFGSFEAFCRAEGLEPDAVAQRFRQDAGARQLLFDLRTIIELESDEHVIGIADSADLIDRLFAGMRPDYAMVNAVRAAKEAGVRTGLVSNSWGKGRYDRSQFPALFDGVVISGEVGLRKPEPRIYELGAERLGLAPADCVFVDDLPGNLKPARELGMATVHHTAAADTVPELERLLGVRLR